MPSLGSTEGRGPDKMRLCPTCRMEISILATKCRFCGEDVGRPREEQRKLTVEDLGGETIEHYAPSSSVMEALEAFRSEEALRRKQTGQKKSSIFSRQSRVEQVPSVGQPLKTGLPPLDAYSRSLASTGGLSRTSVVAKRRVNRRVSRTFSASPWMRMVLWVLAAAVAAALLYLALMKGVPRIRALVLARSSPTVDAPQNPAAVMLESDASPLEILEAAVTHQRRYDNAENREIVEKAAARVEEYVAGLLAKNPYDRENLRQAWDMASKAHAVSPTNRLLDLKNRVSAEVRIYSAMLVNAEPEAKPPHAVLRIVDSDMNETEVTVREGESFLEGRFQLTLVKRDEVCLVDTAYGERKLRCNKVGGIVRF